MVVVFVDHGGKKPEHGHYNDAGYDVFANETVMIQPGHTAKVDLGFGLKFPDGHVAQVMPRSGLSAKGIYCIPGTLDSGYEGVVSACITNNSGEKYCVFKGDKIAQLIFQPVIDCDIKTEEEFANLKKRGDNGFGSTGG